MAVKVPMGEFLRSATAENTTFPIARRKDGFASLWTRGLLILLRQFGHVALPEGLNAARHYRPAGATGRPHLSSSRMVPCSAGRAE
jgi:hypothetical protein